LIFIGDRQFLELSCDPGIKDYTIACVPDAEKKRIISYIERNEYETDVHVLVCIDRNCGVISMGMFLIGQ
jgi:hypothetical protein